MAILKPTLVLNEMCDALNLPKDLPVRAIHVHCSVNELMTANVEISISRAGWEKIRKVIVDNPVVVENVQS